MNKRQNTKQDSPPGISRKESIAETHIVHKAATELYQALILACKLHQEHQLHFRLETRSCNTSEGSFIRFTLGFIPDVGSSGASPIWIAIESEFGMTRMILSNAKLSSDTNALLGAQSLLKRAHESPLFDRQRKKKKVADRKSVHFESSSSSSAMPSATQPRQLKSCLSSGVISPASTCITAATSATNAGNGPDSFPVCSSASSTVNPNTFQSAVNGSLPPPLPDFCQQHDLCSHIAGNSKAVCKTEEGCIGYLGRESPNHRRVLLAPPNDQDQCNPISLAELISSSLAQARSRRFLHLDSIRLAKRLASAILMYHSTPMLEESWDSKDIILYEGQKSMTGRRTDLANPHLSVHMIDSQTPNSSRTLGQRGNIPRDKQIRNLYTYRLGVILLELAFQAPLSKLRAEELEVTDTGTEFEAAKRISETVSTDMGLCFQKIVQKCLNCDFGFGDDLNDANLQAAFHRDVVCGLEGIEDKLSALQLGS